MSTHAAARRRDDGSARAAVAEHPFTDMAPAILTYGYRALSRAFDRYGTDAFAARLLGRPVVFLRGHQAARIFYDETRFERSGAVPAPIKRTLFGKGTVHGLDGPVHRHRKAMFNGLADHEAAVRVADLADAHWDAAARRWRREGKAVIFDEAVNVLGEAVCAWADLPAETDRAQRVADLATIVDGFGSAGPKHLQARFARGRATRWARGFIEGARDGRLQTTFGTPLATVANHRGLDGDLLDETTAADELINLLRPTVAVSWFVSFAALALYHHPEWRERVASGERGAERAFAHEVRRRFPFAPMLAARVKSDFGWRGHNFEKGRLVVLDIYATDHDGATWPRPERFDPERFLHREPGRYQLIPQGGGEPESGHRCPGEPFTMELLGRAARFLARLDYKVPPQDLRYSTASIPTRPRSGFVITEIAP
ncbi:cytochrome P450 [Phytomonospora sp. NPDC050363]|uniref:cytochrome P450 n=1 Tax=Phytomonospora sp. NPDC050363 TaxID=3155642 RepID=UPI0034096ABE